MLGGVQVTKIRSTGEDVWHRICSPLGNLWTVQCASVQLLLASLVIQLLANVHHESQQGLAQAPASLPVSQLSISHIIMF